MTKIEEITRAILNVMEAEIDESLYAGGLMSDRVIPLITRAAVTAMHPLSKRLVSAGAHELTGVVASGCCSRTSGKDEIRDDCECRDGAANVWQAMIDAILNEGNSHD